MGPIFMALLLIAGWGIFAYSAHRRWKLLRVGAPASRFDRIGERLRRTWEYAILQKRMHRYPLAGLAHALIFFGFLILLPRTLALWGRGFDPDFDLWILGTDGAIGKAYSLLKDVFAVLVICGVLVFAWFRVVKRLDRMTLSTEGLVILGIIITMMVADVLYDGASIAQQSRIIAGASDDSATEGPRPLSEPRVLTRADIERMIRNGDIERRFRDDEGSTHAFFVEVAGKNPGYVMDPTAPAGPVDGSVAVTSTHVGTSRRDMRMRLAGMEQVEEIQKPDKKTHATASTAAGQGTNPVPRVTPRQFPGQPAMREVVTIEDVRDRDGNVIGRFPVSRYRELTTDEKVALLASSPILGSPTVSFVAYEPAGSLAAMALSGVSDDGLKVVAHVGFWTHSALVLLFLNLLPYSKHFHVITGVPNVFLQSLDPPGRLPTIDDIDGKLERGETLGIKRIDQFSWKSILDFYTCTECGRCSDHCPATKTGKKLSPKHLTLDLRNFLYKNELPLVGDAASRRASANGNGAAHAANESASQSGEAKSGATGDSAANGQSHTIDLVDGVIDPEVLWACTTCRACEQECPVFISYVDKIVDMRRYLVQERGEFPSQLQAAFRGLESNANPWSFPAGDRANWAEGLGVKTLAEHPEAPVLLWVGCAPSFDERAKKVSRALATLMQKAGVDFAILGAEEQCTGDPARRAGNEYLFQMFARANVETLNRYETGRKKVVTSCPHCFNTLLNEYRDFGGVFDVVHHTTFLSELIASGRLKPAKPLDKRVVFHDSCYLGRYNGVYDAPREALRSVGLTVLEPRETRDRGMCCGAGGAQMFKEEEHGTERVNVARTQQLLDTRPDVVASGCPFCQRMLTDGLAEKGREDVPQVDIAELLLEAMGLSLSIPIND